MCFALFYGDVCHGCYCTKLHLGPHGLSRHRHIEREQLRQRWQAMSPPSSRVDIREYKKTPVYNRQAKRGMQVDRFVKWVSRQVGRQIHSKNSQGK